MQSPRPAAVMPPQAVMQPQPMAGTVLEGGTHMKRRPMLGVGPAMVRREGEGHGVEPRLRGREEGGDGTVESAALSQPREVGDARYRGEASEPQQLWDAPRDISTMPKADVEALGSEVRSPSKNPESVREFSELVLRKTEGLSDE